MDAEYPAGSVLLDVAAWLVTYALHSTVLLVAALCAFALIARAARRSPRVADAAPAWRERIGKVALLSGIATASLQTALSIEPFGLRPALVEFFDASGPAADARGGPIAAEPEAAPPCGAHGDVRTEPALAIPPAPQIVPAVPLYLLPVVGVLQQAVGFAEQRAAADPAPAAASLDAEAPRGPDAAPRIGEPALPGSIDRARWIGAFVVLWAIVAGAAFARRYAGWRVLQVSLAEAEPVTEPEALATFDDLCRRAGLRRDGPRAAVLRVAPLLASPVTRGILRPEICIPPRALRDLDEGEFAALLGHEIAHAARRDPAWLVVFRALEVAFCLQPLNRVVARRLEDDAELLCDDRAVVWTGDRLPLASCLTEVASWLVPGGREPRLAFGMAAHGARLSRRVERLVDAGHSPDAGARRPWPTLLALGLAGGAIGVVPGFAAQRGTRPLPLDVRLELLLATPPSDGSSDVPAIQAVCDEDVPADPEPDPTPGPASEPGPEPCPEPEADPAATTGVRGEAAPVAETAQPALLAFGGAVAELEAELARMRASLLERAGGERFESDLDALSRRVDELRAREAALASLFARAQPTLLSPEPAGRRAEDR